MAEEEKSMDFEAMKALVLKQFKEGKSLTGKGGAFAPLLKQFIEEALEAEIDTHLDSEERGKGNRRNGKSSKTVKSLDGEFKLETPRDRLSEFEPEIVKKRETILADRLESKIIGLYGLGTSLRDIREHIKEMYDTEISIEVLSNITDRIIPLIREWQGRPLEKIYPFIWLDAMFYKVKEEGRIVSKAVYNILGVDVNGKKDLLGIYISEGEGANFWLQVLTDLRNRGVEDILVCSIDGLKGFPEAIETVFPRTEIQLCVIHQIRNSLKYVASKDQRQFIKDLRLVYEAPNLDVAEGNLDILEEKYVKKYPVVINSWRKNWNRLSNYFKYPMEIRKLIYTTNTIEGFHRQVRKVTKTKGVFPSDIALIKLIYLAMKNISKKWGQSIKNWPITLSQMSILFPNRIKLDL